MASLNFQIDFPIEDRRIVMISNEKDRLRLRARLVRKSLHAAAGARAGAALAKEILKLKALPPRAAIAAYYPTGSEIDILPAISALVRRGHRILLPVITGTSDPLVFRHWAPGDPLELGIHNISTPLDSAAAARPDWIFVPLLSVDRAGFRLGQGGGYYDRTLTALRREKADLQAWGVAYAGQVVDVLPRETHDQPLDGILTELGQITMEI